MKIVSNNLKNALKQPTTQRKGRILVNGNYYEVYNVEYYADAYLDGNVIGNAIASQLDFDLPYMDKFETFKYFDGVWTGNDYEYVDMGTFTVFDEQDEDEFNKHITAFDNLIKFNAPFNDIGVYPKTLFQELQNVCNQAGVNLQNMSITNGNFEVENNQFVNGESLKTVLKAICQMSGTYAIIKNDELILQLKNETNENINKEQHEPITWKRKTYGINQVVLGLSDVDGEYVLREDAQDIAQNGVHKLVINDNPFAYTQSKRDELIDALFNQVRGFGYFPYEMNCEWLNYLDIGDIITLDDVETIVLRINGKSPKALESIISAPAVIDSSVDYIDNTNSIENQIKRTEIIVDKQNQEIQALASKVVDISTTETGKGQVKFENATLGALGRISITGNVELFYPAVDEYGGMSVKSGIYKSGMVKASSYKTKSQSKYPSDDLFPRDTYLVIKQEDKEDVKYHLPIKRLNSTGSVSDEFIWEYNKMKIIHRVGIATNGDYYVLPESYEEDLGELEITIPEGDGYFVFESFPFATISITYMLKNEYTETFSTKIETKGEIKVASDEINLDVSKKLEGVSDEEGNVTSASIILAVNKDESSAKIEADKIGIIGKDGINLEGYTTINGGFSVDASGNPSIEAKDDGTLNSASNVLVKSNNALASLYSFGLYFSKYDIYNAYAQYLPYRYYIQDEYDDTHYIEADLEHWLYGTSFTVKDNLNEIRLQLAPNTSEPSIIVSDSDSLSSVTANGMWSPGYNQGSLESKKKNIDFDDGCLQEILDTDICSFNWKFEDDTDQKHIGCIIADEGGNYKVSPKVLTHDKDAIDLYSMSGMSWKAIQELYDIIKLQEQKIKELEGRLDGITKSN